MSDETTLLRCPLCGSNKVYPNIELGKHWVECRECNAESGDYRTEAEAIAVWNTRATYGTLTAEQVREAVEASTFAETSTIREFNDSSWQAIADELNAELGSGTCEVECFDDGVDEGLDGEWFSYAPPTWYLSCGHTSQGNDAPNFCPVCGKVVKR